MYKCLFPWAVGITASNLDEAIRAAQIGGFDGVEFSPVEVADLVEAHGPQYVIDRFAQAGIVPGGFGLPTEWRTEETAWRQGLEALPRLAKAAAAIGCTRTTTWILSGDNTRPLEENRRFHVERFQPIARVLADAGIRLGLEFLGPKTLRDSFVHPFYSTMEPMLEMGREIGPNVGLLLDSWHWYTSGGTLADLNALRPEQVVYVHVNDAPVGVARDAQIDSVRCLPGETGVIDIAGFLQAMRALRYDGPVTPEPFKKELHDLPSDEARLLAVGKAMDAIFTKAGIAVG